MDGRLALAVPTLFLVSVIVFGLMRLMPGDVATRMVEGAATPARSTRSGATWRRPVTLELALLTILVSVVIGIVVGILAAVRRSRRSRCRTSSWPSWSGWCAQLVSVHGAPRYLRSDNGPEFVARAILRWLQTAAIETAFIDPGKP